MRKTISIDLPKDFSFKSTAYSHGWCELPPFELDTRAWTLKYVFTDGAGRKHVLGTLSEQKRKLKIELSNSGVADEKIIADVRHILRLDDDLAGFYATLEGHEALAWVAVRRAGRLLRSATVWEDLVKTMCTTNCSWALTKNMVRNLVEKLGSEGAFPTPKAMASVPEAFYRNEIRAGYRSPYFLELAQAVASGELDPEAWLSMPLATTELKKEMKKVKGIGDYAAENLLKLVGRYDGLALDSWLRSQFYKKHNSEKLCKDEKIVKHYAKFGEWRGLAIWCDMTEKWIA